MRRDYRLKAKLLRMDADEEPNNEQPKGSHGNTRLPYGLAKSKGIDTTGMTPRDVWAALEGEGVSPSAEYRKLKGRNNGKESGVFGYSESREKGSDDVAGRFAKAKKNIEKLADSLERGGGNYDEIVGKIQKELEGVKPGTKFALSFRSPVTRNETREEYEYNGNGKWTSRLSDGSEYGADAETIASDITAQYFNYRDSSKMEFLPRENSKKESKPKGSEKNLSSVSPDKIHWGSKTVDKSTGKETFNSFNDPLEWGKIKGK